MHVDALNSDSCIIILALFVFCLEMISFSCRVCQTYVGGGKGGGGTTFNARCKYRATLLWLLV